MTLSIVMEVASKERMTPNEIVIEQEISTRGIVTYSTELVHHGLSKHRRIKDQDYSAVCMRAELQLKQWDEQWLKKAAREKAARERAAAQQEKEEAQRQAALQTEEAKQRLGGLENTLKHTLTHDDTIDWDSLKDRGEFPESMPTLTTLPPEPTATQPPAEPQRSALKYQPQLKFLDKLSAKRRAAREEEARDRFAKDHNKWKKEADRVRRNNLRLRLPSSHIECLTFASLPVSLPAWRRSIRY